MPFSAVEKVEKMEPHLGYITFNTIEEIIIKSDESESGKVAHTTISYDEHGAEIQKFIIVDHLYESEWHLVVRWIANHLHRRGVERVVINLENLPPEELMHLKEDAQQKEIDKLRALGFTVSGQVAESIAEKIR